jgi:hypothetical protein
VLRTARGCALGVALCASPLVAATIELRALAVDGEPVADRFPAFRGAER